MGQGFTKNIPIDNDGTLSADSDFIVPSQRAIKTYVDTELSTKQGTIPYTTEDAANKSTSTSLGTSDTLYPTQNAVKSYVDTGLTTKENSLGYTAEDSANKSTSTSLGTSDTLYPSQKAVKTYVDNGDADIDLLLVNSFRFLTNN